MKKSLLLALVCWLLVTVHEASAQINVSFSVVEPACYGLANGSATVTAVGGTSPYSYLWSNGQISQTTQNIGAGVYTVTVTDDGGLTATGSVAVNAPSQVAAEVLVSNVLCANDPMGGAVNAVISGGTPPYTVLWNDGNTNVIRANLPAGTYIVVATDAHGCTDIAQGTVIAPPPLVAAVIAITPACGGSNNGSATIFAAGGVPPYTHTWSPGGFTGTTVTGLAPGQYYVCTFDANGCQKDLWVDIPSIDSLDVSLSVLSAECTGINDGVVTAFVNPPGNYTYEWNLQPFHGVTQLTGLAPNTFVSVTVTDPVSGCTGSASTTVSAHTSIDISVVDTDIACAGLNTGTATATASGGTPAYQYQWLIPPTGPQIGNNAAITGLSAGAYMVSVTDSRGCTAIGVADIGILSDPNAIIGGSTTVKCDSTESVLQFINLSTDTYDTIVSWVWTITTPTDTLTFANMSPIQLTLPVGVVGTAQLVATSSTGCSDTAIDTFKVPGLPHISLNTGPMVMGCGNDPVHIIVSGGNPSYTYVWSPLTGLTLDSIPPNAVANPTVTTTYQLIASDQGCADTVAVTVVRKSTIEISVDNDLIKTCDSTAVLFAHANVPNVIWVDAAGNVLGNPPGSNPVTVPVGNMAVYTAIATDTVTGCVDSISVTVMGLQDISLQTDSVLWNCENGPVHIIVTGGNPSFTYVWSPLTNLTFDSIPPNVTVNPPVTTTYQLIATSGAGCSDTVSVTVVRVTPIDLSVEDSVIVTCDSTVQLIATSNVPNVIWVDAQGNVLGNNPVTVPVLAGTTNIYTVIATDSLGCVDSLDVSVTGLPDIHLTSDSLLWNCENSPIHIIVTGGSPGLTYTWSPLTDLTFDSIPPNVTVNPTVTTTYQLIASSGGGCADTVSVIIVRVTPIDLSVEDSVIVTCDSTVQLVATSNVPNVIWVDAQGNVLGNNPVTVTVTAGVTAIYTVIATDSLGCADSLHVSVTGLPGIQLTADSVLWDCENGPVHITVQGGDPSFTYVWSPLAGLTFDSIPPGVTANPDSTTTYQLIASNGACVDTLYVTVIRVTPIELSVEDSVIVTCDSTATLVATANVPNVIWINAAGDTLGVNPVTVSVIPGTTNIYTVIASDSLGCADSLHVSVTGLPGVHLTADSVLWDCENGPVHIDVQGGDPSFTYVWTPLTGLTFDSIPPGVTANPDSTTTYQLIASNGACADTLQVTVIRVVPIELSVADSVIVTCDSTVTLAATANVPNVLWINAAGDTLGVNPVTIPVTAGITAIYTVIATDSLGCADSLQVSVTGLPGVNLHADSVLWDCDNAPVHIQVTGGSPDYTYVWSPTTDLTLDSIPPSAVVNPPVTTTYQLIASNGVCTDTVTVTVIRVIPIELSVEDSVIVTCDSTAQLVATSNVPNVIWVNTAGDTLGTNPVTVSVTTGVTEIYTAIATDSLGCVDSIQVSVTGLQGINLTSDSILIDCANAPVSIIVQGGSQGFTYVWSPLTGLTFDSIPPNVTANPDTTTTYQLIGSSGECVDTLYVTVIRVIPIELSVEDSVIVTCDSTVTLVATSNVPEVIWINAAGDTLGANPLTVPVTVGVTAIYTVIASDSLGCVDSLQVSVTGLPGVHLNADSVLWDCDNAPLHIVVTGGSPDYTYVWTPTTDLTLDSIPPSAVVNPPVTTVYQLIASNGLCSDTISVNIIRVIPIELSVADSVIVTCDSTVQLVAIANVPNVIWLNAAGDTLGNNPITVTVTTGITDIYTVIATDSLGCADTIQVSVTGVGVDVTVDPTIPGVVCEGTGLQLGLINNHPGDTLQYQWTVTPPMVITGETTGTPVVDGLPGDYQVTVTVTNQYGCTQTLVIPVQVLPADSIDGTISVDLCNGKIVAFVNNSGYSGVWSFGDSVTSTLDNPTHTYETAGTYQVVFTPDTTECVVPWDSLIQVQETPLDTPGIAHDYQICVDSAVIAFSGTSANPNVTWSWTFSNGTPSVSNLQNPVVTFTTEENITATLVITDINGCSIDSVQEVPVIFIHDYIQEALTFCIDTTVQLNADGVDPTASYIWTSVPFDSTLVATDKNPTVSPEVQTTYSVTISDGANCTVTYQVVVTPMEGPNLEAQHDTIVCSDGPLSLIANGGGLNFQWSTTVQFDSIIGTNDTLMLTTAANGWYYVRTFGLGCSALDSVKVRIEPVAIQPEPFDGDICLGEETLLLVTNLDILDTVTYTWTPALANIPNPSVSPTQETTYQVIVTNQFGCKDTLDFHVNVTTIDVTAEVTGPQILHTGESTTLLATAVTNGVIQSYLWTPPTGLSDVNIPDPEASPTADQVYVVTATTVDGCIDSASVLVQFISSECQEPYIFVPKAFTPNNDTNNDFFIVKGVNITELQFIVWDRWGEKVYETTDLTAQGWDGSYNGKEATPDSYAWYIRARCENGMIYEKKGNVTLLK